MNFFIGIPTINRADLLNDALKKYVVDFPNTSILVRDNGNQNFFVGGLIQGFTGGGNMGVAESWNFLLKTGFEMGFEYGMILNDDIYLGKNEKEIAQYLETHEDRGFMVCRKNWSVMILKKSTFESVGDFDKGFFPAYFEDNDYCYRMRLKAIPRIHDDYLNPLIYRNSMSIQKDPTLNQNFERNRQRFIQKWGGVPKQEKFKTPFNQ